MSIAAGAILAPLKAAATGPTTTKSTPASVSETSDLSGADASGWGPDCLIAPSARPSWALASTIAGAESAAEGGVRSRNRGRFLGRPRFFGTASSSAAAIASAALSWKRATSTLTATASSPVARSFTRDTSRSSAMIASAPSTALATGTPIPPASRNTIRHQTAFSADREIGRFVRRAALYSHFGSHPIAISRAESDSKNTLPRRRQINITSS